VVGLTEEAVMRITSSKLEKLQADYNEFYTMFYDISRFDVTTIIHLESAADRLLAGAAHYALSRWESLHFIERAMKEVLEQKGVRLSVVTVMTLVAHFIVSGLRLDFLLSRLNYFRR
jgi:hypothetical protein